MTEFNAYCDESCHLEHDGINAMGLGAVWTKRFKTREINRRIREIKKRGGICADVELKWTKVSPAKVDVYCDLINYFFDEADLHFRCLLVPDKSLLDHRRFAQSHDDWYYKMYFDLLKAIFERSNAYNVYLDIKDANSGRKARKLQEVCRNSIYDFSVRIVKRIQPIRSEEVEIMQLVDFLTGAVCYANRNFPSDHKKSSAKVALIELIKKRSEYSLRKSTLLKEDKFNLFVWNARLEQ